MAIRVCAKVLQIRAGGMALDVIIGSFFEGGAPSRKEKGQPEVFQIQNASPLYAGVEWDKKRIEIFQTAWLKARLAAQRLATHAVTPLFSKLINPQASNQSLHRPVSR